VLVLVNPRSAGATFGGPSGRIAYQAWDGIDSEIYTIPATGGTPVKVTDKETGAY
jgi:hypothetical protein